MSSPKIPDPVPPPAPPPPPTKVAKKVENKAAPMLILVVLKHTPIIEVKD
jgi:hypothetical protein